MVLKLIKRKDSPNWWLLGVRSRAKLADVSVDTVSTLERGEERMPRTVAAIRSALGSARIILIDQNGNGPGVRLRDRQG